MWMFEVSTRGTLFFKRKLSDLQSIAESWWKLHCNILPLYKCTMFMILHLIGKIKFMVFL